MRVYILTQHVGMDQRIVAAYASEADADDICHEQMVRAIAAGVHEVWSVIPMDVRPRERRSMIPHATGKM